MFHMAFKMTSSLMILILPVMLLKHSFKVIWCLVMFSTKILHFEHLGNLMEALAKRS